MRFLTGLVVVLVLAWSGYWYVGSRSIENALTTWIEARRAEGWVADYGEISTRGYPNRFDTAITELALADPATGLAWQMPRFEILTLSYTPNHIIAAFPPEQIVASPLQRILITSERMRGSVVFDPDTSLRLNRTSFELEKVGLTSTEGWDSAIESGQLHTRQTEGVTDGHDIYFEARGFEPSGDLLRFLDPGGLLPEVFDGMVLDLKAVFDAPWNRFALERGRPQLTELTVTKFSAEWGELLLEAAGTLEVDAEGWPTGKLDLRARNWRDMLRIAEQTGVVPTSMLPTITNALELLAGMSGNPETIDAPLSFRRGRMFFAGLPVGAAPNLTIR